MQIKRLKYGFVKIICHRLDLHRDEISKSYMRFALSLRATQGRLMLDVHRTIPVEDALLVG
jgi:hypothetical protein